MKVELRHRVFDVYTEKEAAEAGIVPVENWRAAQEGDWIKSIDKKIFQVFRTIYKKPSGNRKGVTILRTGYGDIAVTRSCFYAREYRLDSESRTRRPINDVKVAGLQRAFLNHLISNGDTVVIGGRVEFTTDSIINSYMAVYSENNKTAALKRATFILNKKSCKLMLAKLMKDELRAVGIDKVFLAEKLKEMLENKEGKYTGTIEMAAWKEAAEIHKEKKFERHEKEIVYIQDGSLEKLMSIMHRMLDTKTIEAISEEFQLASPNET